jgi:hypothetical protein
MGTIQKTKTDDREYFTIRFDPKVYRILTIILSITTILGVALFYIKHL